MLRLPKINLINFVFKILHTLINSTPTFGKYCWRECVETWKEVRPFFNVNYALYVRHTYRANSWWTFRQFFKSQRLSIFCISIVLLENSWNSKQMITEGEAAIPLKTTLLAFRNQEKTKQRSVPIQSHQSWPIWSHCIEDMHM